MNRLLADPACLQLYDRDRVETGPSSTRKGSSRSVYSCHQSSSDSNRNDLSRLVNVGGKHRLRSFFARRKFDDWTGRALGVLTLTPYDYWRRAHATHHASAGNLDERGIGDITTMTVAEYYACSRPGRLAYRLYRHPIVMFGIGPAWLFIFKQRLPIGMMGRDPLPGISTMATNLAIAIASGLIIWAIGLVPFLLVHLPVVLLAGAAGIWLFYVQHQFEETHWSKPGEWHFPQAALHGASHYDLPIMLRWLTGNIGVHHVHHLSSRIPYYRLPEVLKDHPELADIGRITLRQSLSCVSLALWDEQSGKLVSFREAKAASLRERSGCSGSIGQR